MGFHRFDLNEIQHDLGMFTQANERNKYRLIDDSETCQDMWISSTERRDFFVVDFFDLFPVIIVEVEHFECSHPKWTRN